MLAKHGVIMNRTYVQPVCSPTRSAFMSGRFPIHTGLQHEVIRPPQPYGLPLNITTIAQHLQSAGYSTHAIGKWHLGFCNTKYTPTERGFDSHFGYYVGAEDYYTHRRSDSVPNKAINATKPELEVDGLDFRNNTDLVLNMNGTYSTIAFALEAQRIVSQHNPQQPLYLYLPFQAVHAPLEVPQRYIDMYLHIQDQKRRTFAGMVTAMDEAIGNITATFQKHGLWENTLMIFTTDNGGPVTVGANNYPLRGSKHTVWEGGTRDSVFVYGSMLEKTGYVNNELVHSVDWYPTLMTAAGIPITDTDIDGMDMWDTISKGMASKREHFVYNIDTNIPVAAIRYKQWKLIVGDPGSPSGWYPQPNASVPGTQSLLASTDNTTTYLFDLDADPTEHFNVADENKEIVSMMKMRLEETMKTYVHDLSTLNPPTAKSNPANFGDAWSPGWC